MESYQTHNLLELSASIARINLTAPVYAISVSLTKLQKLGASLRKRYDAAGHNYNWALLPQYRDRTLQLEEKATEIAGSIGAKLEFNRTPQGWPLKLHFNNQDFDIG